MVQVVVPSLGESVSSATIAKWFKSPGEAVKKDEPLVELETDKVTMEVNAPESGVLAAVSAKEGDSVEIGAVLGEVDPTGAAAAGKAEAASAPQAAKSDSGANTEGSGPAKDEATPEGNIGSRPAAMGEEKPTLHNTATAAEQHPTPQASGDNRNGPAADKLMAENPGVKPEATGKDGRITKGDVLSALAGGGQQAASAQPGPSSSATASDDKREERVKMTKLRSAIARRLKESQNTAAILTTFNDIDMSNVIGLRNEYKDAFEKKYGIKLGFMGFFVKAAVAALKEIPEVNAQIDGDTLIYKNYYDIGVAVGTENGLVVPVVRNADQLSLAGIEKEIGNLAKKAREGKLTMGDMSGGTFTVSNGGVYGSLMSTPIINPPQSGILGMHRTEDRPVAVKGQVVVRPMMYIALSYDHRIVDGRESVTFLKTVKEVIEDPRRLLLEV